MEKKTKGTLEEALRVAFLFTPLFGDREIHRLYEERREELGVDINKPNWESPKIREYKNLQLEGAIFFFVKYGVPVVCGFASYLVFSF